MLQNFKPETTHDFVNFRSKQKHQLKKSEIKNVLQAIEKLLNITPKKIKIFIALRCALNSSVKNTMRRK